MILPRVLDGGIFSFRLRIIYRKLWLVWPRKFRGVRLGLLIFGSLRLSVFSRGSLSKLKMQRKWSDNRGF